MAFVELWPHDGRNQGWHSAPKRTRLLYDSREAPPSLQRITCNDLRNRNRMPSSVIRFV